MTIGERIRKKREEIGISQTELAKKVGISKQTLYKYETNIITNIPSNTIENIANILNLSPAILMGWENEKIPNNIKQTHTSQIDVLVGKTNNLNQKGIEELSKYTDCLLTQKKYQKVKTQEMAM